MVIGGDDVALSQFQLQTSFLAWYTLAIVLIVKFKAQLCCYTAILALRLLQFDHIFAAKALRAIRERFEACDKLLSLMGSCAASRLYRSLRTSFA